MLAPFHLAILVDDLTTCRRFYTKYLGCTEGRSDTHWVDLNFFGHQLVLHEQKQQQQALQNPVDGDAVPVPHFGVVLAWDDWQTLSGRLQSAEIDFIIKPKIRFKGQVGEQATLFFRDPAGNALEFKAFKDPKQLFAK